MIIELSDDDVERIAEAVARRLAPAPRPLSLADASRELGVSVRTLNRLSSRGLLRVAKLGARTVVPRSEIDRLLASEVH